MSLPFDTLIIDVSTSLKRIEEFINFLMDFFEDLVYVNELCFKFMLRVPSYFVWLPGPIVMVLTVALAIVVTYKIVGREG